MPKVRVLEKYLLKYGWVCYSTPCQTFMMKLFLQMFRYTGMFGRVLWSRFLTIHRDVVVITTPQLHSTEV